MAWTPPDGFSMLIPTHNRSRYLARALAYYGANAPGLSILVADSSAPEGKAADRALVASARGLDITHVDTYDSSLPPYRKMLDAICQADSEFVAICADDDFLTPTAMTLCVAHLAGHPDCSVAHGRYVKFTASAGGFRFDPLYSWSSDEEPDPAKRLRAHLAGYPIPTMYSVQRRRDLREVFSEAVASTSDLRLGELLPSALLLIRGKRKCVDALHGAREAMEGSAGRTARRLPPFDQLAADPEYARFRACIARHLRAACGADEAEASALVDSAVRQYADALRGLGARNAYGRLRKRLVPESASAALARLERGVKSAAGLVPPAEAERAEAFERIVRGPGRMHDDLAAIKRALDGNPVA